MNPHGRTDRASMTADEARRTGLLAESWPAEEVLAWGAEQFAPRITLATGFGVEGCVIIDLIARNDLPIDLFTLDTGLLFPETYTLWKTLERHYGVTIRAVRPAQTVEEQARTLGAALWEREPERCCARRKVTPADRHPRRVRRLGHRDPPRTDDGARRGAGDRVGRSVRAGEGQPVDPLDQSRSLELRPAPGRAVQSSSRPRLSQHRLRALHEPGRGRRGRARRTLARHRQDGVRTSPVMSGDDMSRQPGRGAIVWLTGMSGAGKSTVAQALKTRLERWHAVEILDGDEVREHLSKGLTFSKEDRDTNVRRIGFVARLLAKHGVIVDHRGDFAVSKRRATEVRRAAERDGVTFVEVYANAELQTLVDRDVKGLYKQALAGELPHFTGVSDPYEPPPNPDVVVRSDRETVEVECRARARLADRSRPDRSRRARRSAQPPGVQASPEEQ